MKCFSLEEIKSLYNFEFDTVRLYPKIVVDLCNASKVKYMALYTTFVNYTNEEQEEEKLLKRLISNSSNAALYYRLKVNSVHFSYYQIFMIKSNDPLLDFKKILSMYKLRVFL